MVTPPARGSRELKDYDPNDLSLLLPARSHDVWGQQFSDALEMLIGKRGWGSVLDDRLASHAALQIGLLVLANERLLPPAHPSQLAEYARDVVKVTSFDGRVAAELSGLWSTPQFVTSESSNSDRVTQQHYGALFGDLDLEHYIDEASGLLDARLARNGISKAALTGRKVLDAGCGSGRYSQALSSYGASEVVGVDFSPENIRNAVAINSRYVKSESVSFELADIRKLPFPDDSFDVVFSNGVVHHLPDPSAGVTELLRVLKPGGWGFFKVMPNPGGLHWDLIELARLVLWHTPFEVVHEYFADAAIPANLRYYLLDHMLVPYNSRFSRREVEAMLTREGATKVRFLERGADLDRVERIHRGEPFAALRFGDGECRNWFSK